MTIRVWRLLVVVVLMCAVVLVLPAPSRAQDTDQQFTGGWVHYLNGMLPALVTFHSDGTFLSSSSLMFGSPTMPESPVTYSPVHGVWEKSGPKSVLVTSLFFVFELDGRMRGYIRNRIVLELGKDRDTYTGNLFLDELRCGEIGVFSCPNPLDPEQIWTAHPHMPAGGYQVTGYRLKTVPYPY